MKPHYLAIVLLLATATVAAESTTDADATVGTIITNMTATATQGTGSFDGVVNEKSDLDELLETAWGESWLGLHRGHSPIKNVLKAFLGINHAEMHVYMEEQELNLAATCKKLGFEPENLVESLTLSFMPFIEQGVENGVIGAGETTAWQEKIRDAFSRRVYWEG